MKTFAQIVAICLLFVGNSKGNADDRPNVVMIISDDHAWTDYGFMGHKVVQTPNIDRLAKSGLTFRRGYVTSSLCCPSLASIITGMYPHQHKITSNDPPIPEGMTNAEFNRSPLFQEGRERMNKHMEACVTLPRLLKENGYQSLQTGKWWQGDYTRGGFTDGMTKGGRHGDDGLIIGRKTMEPITSFIDKCIAAKSPFMVWYAPLLPHDPHTPPDRLLEKYKGKTDSIHIARYWAMIEWFDESVGQLLDGLKERGQLENTIVVYIADNGWIQSRDNTRYAPKSKQSQYDGGVRTPIMIHWPKKIAARMSDELAQSIDLLPTLRSALGLAVDASLPGINLLDEKAVASRKAIFGECFTHNSNDLDRPEKSLRWRWMIDGNTKLIVPNTAVEAKAETELYQLDSDPTEMNNLAGLQSESVLELKKTLDSWWAPDR
ncbi:MAG: sulfatase [Planctomycetota bacterium]|nr:sulfatase [Planctomycetota bacterium]